LEKALIIGIIDASMPDPIFEQEEKKRGLALKISYWYVSNKVLLRRIFIGILAGIAGLIWLFALWNLLDYFVISWGRNQRMMQELVNNQVFSQQWINANMPRPIEVGTARVFKSGEDYDFLSRISSSSPKYWAEYDYNFTYSGGETAPGEGFVLPISEKWVSKLSQESDSRPSNSKLVISNIMWHRIDPAEVPNYEEWRDERLNLEITDIEQTTEGLDGAAVAKTKFNVYNRSAFGYYEIGFHVIPYRGSTPIGVNYIVIDSLESGEKREVEVSWFDSLAQVSKIEIEPEVNLFDESNYIR